VGLSFSHNESLYHIPGGAAAASLTRLDPHQDRLQAQGEYRFTGGPFEAVRFWLNGSNYKHSEIGLDSAGVDGVQATFKNREVEGRVELQHTPVALAWGNLTGAAGVQAGRSQLGTAGAAGGLLSPTDSRSVAGYVFEQLAFGGGFQMQGAARIEGARSSGTATLFPAGLLPDGNPLVDESRRRNFAPKSVSFGMLQDLPLNFVASLTGQYVERAPAATELFAHGAHDAPGTFEIGDPNLKLERARSIEFGLRRSEGPVRIDASAYYTRYTGFIYRRLTGVMCGDDFATCGVDPELNQIVYSQQNAKFYGVDLGAQYDAFALDRGVFGFTGQFDFVRAKFDDGTDVPRIPPYRLGGGLFWRGSDGLYAKVSLLHAFAHTEVAPLETTTPGYNNLKVELSYSYKAPKHSGLSEVTVGLIGDNLLNEQMRNSASFKKDEILLPGRGVRAYVSARF
jgi:iron complex outermembrane receptor protein